MIADAPENGRQSIIREFQAPRVSQDDIIIQNEQTLSTIQSVVCPVCLMVLSLPHWACEKCDNVFCKQCLEQWWSRNPKTCIFKCEDTTFKIIKRSQIYQALMEILKVKCKQCQQAISISNIDSHDKICPKKLMLCQLEGCGKQIIRQEYQNHIKQCNYRRGQCPNCKQLFLIGSIQNHTQNQCLDRQIICENKGCGGIFKARDFNEHFNNCEFKNIVCGWCSKEYNKKIMESHQQQCQSRTFECQWCKLAFLGHHIKQHSNHCSQKKQICPLCQLMHRYECMFNNLVALNQSHRQLSQQNTKLKLRVHQLQQQLQDSIKNRHELTLNSLIKLKQQQKKQLEKDLLRIKNGLQSIVKMRNEELHEHQKKFHLSTSLCVICNVITKKLEDDIEPLIRMQEQVMNKIKQIQRIQNATRKSIIRIKEN